MRRNATFPGRIFKTAWDKKGTFVKTEKLEKESLPELLKASLLWWTKKEIFFLV